jgi:hypothetical protein
MNSFRNLPHKRRHRKRSPFLLIGGTSRSGSVIRNIGVGSRRTPMAELLFFVLWL